jgi:hypothetical protein
MLFAQLKCIHRLGRLRLCGPSGAKDELLLALTAKNLRKLAKPSPSRADLRHMTWRPSF